MRKLQVITPTYVNCTRILTQEVWKTYELSGL